MQTFIDKYIDQGRAKGKHEGLQEGKQEGGALLLTCQLKKRFGSLPDWAGQKLKEADSATLETWGLNLLSANRLEDIFSIDH